MLLGRLGLGLGIVLVLGLGFRVRVTVSINIKYILYFIHVLHFMHLHSVGGAIVLRTECNIISRTTYRACALNVMCSHAVSTVHAHVPCTRALNITCIGPLRTLHSHGA